MATTHTKIAAGVGIALLLLAGASIAIWSLSQPSVPAPNSTYTKPSSTPNTALADPAPDATFENVYKEPANKEDVVLIRPPYIDARLDFYEKSDPEQAQRIPRGPDAMLIAFDNGKPKIWGMTFGNGRGYAVQQLIELLLKIEPPNIEDSANLLKKQIKGDFIISGLPMNDHPDWRHGLEQILTDSFGEPVSLNFRDVDRPVYVLHGQWTPKHPDGTPWTPDQHPSIEIYGAALNRGLNSGGGGSGSPEDFAKDLGSWIHQSIVLDPTNPPQMIGWHFNDSPDTPDPDSVSLSHDPDLVLKHVSEQTGLAVTQETRKIRRLFIDIQK